MLPIASDLIPRGRRLRRQMGVCQYFGSVALSVVADCADVSRSVVSDLTELVGTVFSGLSALVIEDVEGAGAGYPPLSSPLTWAMVFASLKGASCKEPLTVAGTREEGGPPWGDLPR